MFRRRAGGGSPHQTSSSPVADDFALPLNGSVVIKDKPLLLHQDSSLMWTRRIQSIVQRKKHHASKVMMLSGLVLFGLWVVQQSGVARLVLPFPSTTSPRLSRLDPNYPAYTQATIVFSRKALGNNDEDGIVLPPRLKDMRHDSSSVDTGGVSHNVLEHPQSIDKDETKEKQSSSWYNPEYATDDDVVRAQVLDFEEDESSYEVDHQGHCRRVAEHMLQFPTCTLMHEQDRVGQDGRLLGSGSYRQVFGLRNHGHASTYNPEQRLESEYFALKQLRYRLDPSKVNYRDMIRMDALIPERLTADPYLVDIYAHCGVSVLTEFFFHGDLEGTQVIVASGKRDDRKRNYRKWFGYADLEYEQNRTTIASYNDMTWEERLQSGVDMARGLAALHGHVGGVLVHDDVQVVQFLYNADKSILKLNDFNRAEWMLWDDERQDYCRYKNGVGPGPSRSPEEYWDNPLNEKIDVYSLGNALYQVVTGLYPFFQYTDDEADNTKRLVKKGVRPYLHPDWKNHGFAAQALMLVMEQCWIEDPDKRPSIFQVLQMLQAAWEIFQERKRQGKENS